MEDKKVAMMPRQTWQDKGELICGDGQAKFDIRSSKKGRARIDRFLKWDEYRPSVMQDVI